MFVTLDLAKAHLNIDSDYNEDNDYILHCIQSAESATAKRLNVKNLGQLLNSEGYLPDDVIHSVLLLCGSFYSARETFSYQSVNKMSHSFDFLADLNRNYNEPF